MLGLRLNKLLYIVIVVVLAVLAISLFMYYTATKTVSILSEKLDKPMNIAVYSPAFSYGSRIPVKYTCDGLDISIPVKWDPNTLPKDTRSLVLVMFDPDAPRGVFIHWILYNIPLNITEIPENIPRKPLVKGIGLQGINDFGRIGYGGPCPPKGSSHRYFIRLFALDTVLDLKPGVSIKELEEALRGHILAYGETMGVYGR